MTGRPALFLDRDGVINVDHGYVHRIEQVEFVDGIFDLCRTAQDLGYLLIIATNQAGIGRGYYTERDFHALTDWMRAEFAARGITVADVFFCPHHPEDGIGPYRCQSVMRKPAPGMILAAAAKHGLDLGRSVLVGDKLSDVEAGLAAGVRHNVLLTTDASVAAGPTPGVVVMDTLHAIARWLSARGLSH